VFSANYLNEGRMQPDIIALGEPMLEFNAEEEGALSEVRHFAVGWGSPSAMMSGCIRSSFSS